MKRVMLFTLGVCLCCGGFLTAANVVDIVATGPGVKADTIWTDQTVEMQISVENDIKLGGIGFGFNLYNPEGGVTLSYPAQADGFGYYEALTVNAASRMFPTASVWDLGNLIVSDTGLDMANAGLDGNLPDTINIGGVALMGGLPVGAMEHMLSLHFTATGPGVAEYETLCMDSGFIPPAAPFVFIDGGGSTLAPAVTWAEGGLCFVVTDPGQWCPEFDSGLPTSMDVDHCGSNSVTLSASDGESDQISFGLTENTGSGSAIVTDNGDGTCEVTYTATAADVGTAVTVTVFTVDPYHSTEGCNFYTINVNVTNNAPTIDCGIYFNPACFDNPITKTDISATDADECDNLTFSLVSGPGSIDASTGLYTWNPTIADIGYHIITVGVTDGFTNSTECSFEIAVTTCEWYEVKIDMVPDVIQGHFIDLPVRQTKGSDPIGGFDFLLTYDNTLLTFSEASLGQYFSDCGWEYFTYRQSWNGNCGSACPTGQIRLVGLAETNNGPYHPDYDCIGGASATDEIIANLTFFVTSDVNANNQLAHVKFFWMDCGDNSISVPSGDTLAISRYVYNYYGSDGIDTYIDVTDNDTEFPTYYGVPNSCILDFAGSSTKTPPVRFIDLFNGGIKIIDKNEIDDRGDVNMNGISNEISDAVMLTNFFISGASAFYDHVDGSIAASDINADGTPLTVADLVYLVRIIIGDAVAYPKPIPGAFFNASFDGTKLSIDTDIDAGAALFVFDIDGLAGTPTVNNGMDVVYEVIDKQLRVLVYNIGTKKITSETELTIPVNGSAELIEVEAATYNGAVLESTIRNLPQKFTVHQNFPNPFNPTTTISFDLNTASEWTVDIYNITGQKVNSFTGASEAGLVEIAWDSKNTSGTAVSSGIYFYKISAGTVSATMKMILTK
ncbi:MAG: T9SS type A sorting domain-containing protein [candidate division Zixibacteria bacterium]|nr:T9SS type A sorting domain-containing protein [candidate division Zixibacteria bacterium]